MKRDDPRLVKLRRQRDAASLHCDTMLKGFAEAIKNAYVFNLEDLAPFVDELTGPISEAVKALEEAQAQWSKVSPRRRVHHIRRRVA